jgi:hypothetical protein
MMLTVSESSTPAGWYEDPALVAELRYWDGTAWTEHVSSGGTQSVSPMPLPDAAEAGSTTSPLDADAFTVERTTEFRDSTEHGLDVLVDGGLAARFEPIVEGAPGYRLHDPSGSPLLTVTKPGLKATVDVAGSDGAALGGITKVGRLHSRYELKDPDGAPLASVKLILGDDRWEIRTPSDDVVAAMARVVRTPADGLALAGVDYHVSVTARSGALQPLLVVLPVAIDILDTQTG